MQGACLRTVCAAGAAVRTHRLGRQDVPSSPLPAYLPYLLACHPTEAVVWSCPWYARRSSRVRRSSAGTGGGGGNISTAPSVAARLSSATYYQLFTGGAPNVAMHRRARRILDDQGSLFGQTVART